MVFQGGVFVDTSFPTLGRNGNEKEQLDNQKKMEIENILNDEFCSLNVVAQTEDKACSIQNLEFRVKVELVVEFS